MIRAILLTLLSAAIATTAQADTYNCTISEGVLGFKGKISKDIPLLIELLNPIVIDTRNARVRIGDLGSGGQWSKVPSGMRLADSTHSHWVFTRELRVITISTVKTSSGPEHYVAYHEPGHYYVGTCTISP